jgi:hypothetical protein
MARPSDRMAARPIWLTTSKRENSGITDLIFRPNGLHLKKTWPTSILYQRPLGFAKPFPACNFFESLPVQHFAAALLPANQV